MKRIIKISFFILILWFIIPFSCKENRIRILDINLEWTDKYFKGVDVFTKESGIMIHVITLYDKLSYYQKSSSDCFAFDPSLEIVNPIDTSTMQLYCNINIIVSEDTILSESNLLSDPSIKGNIASYDDSFGGFTFELRNDEEFYDKLDFMSNMDSSILFTFQAKTIDNIFLKDSIRINIDWE